MIQEVKKQLYELADTEYREFNKKLMPGTENVLGVRLPVLRKIAKELAKGDYRLYLSEADETTHEETMLQGLVIGYAKMDMEERMEYLKNFIPKITNWAVCDSCCMGYHFMEKDREAWFSFLKDYWGSGKEFEIRFAVVALFSHFADQEYVQRIFQIFNSVQNEGYYVRMAVAWAISVFYVKFKEETEEFLENNHLDTFTQNKAVQKIRESYRVSKEEKEQIKKFRRTEEK
ncbi:DNA alkylation repair protein [Lachnoclostridium sp. An181]|uniref:DNA alkylation repair protein n=1 Tax=Lachnoclostridium sp. An181 TaxID=1965575 RepID=UPI000B3A99BF|nr:DNA alkylation repair protein [Lachnoclostridium sp. An181]OUP50907.1 DNA alkylation repair protein [Lachnoclostridium sp. An181]